MKRPDPALTTVRANERASEDTRAMAEPGLRRPILIVVGTSLRAEEADRPLGYFLKQRIEQAVQAGDGPSRLVYVVADLRWLHDESLQNLPTVSLGGPGVNLLTHRWVEELPVAMAVDERFYIQMDPDLDELHVSLWGMDHDETQVAVGAFERRYLPKFLEQCAEGDDEVDEDDEDEDDA
jgi:hypothetical protein